MSQAIAFTDKDRLAQIFTFLRERTGTHDDEIVCLNGLVGCLEEHMTADDLNEALDEFERRLNNPDDIVGQMITD